MLVKIVIALLIGLALVTPLIETVDFWDNPALPNRDTEINVLSILSALSGLLLLARNAVWILCLVLRRTNCRHTVQRCISYLVAFLAFRPQPFLPSSAPLRI